MKKLYRLIRSWWYINILGKPPEFVQLLDFFDNPVAPWNKKRK